MLALSRGLRRQAELNTHVAAHLRGYRKWLYLATNVPYFAVAFETMRDGSALPWCGSTTVAAFLVL
eukprot:CAMPEP_0119289316 /NCGR_PEP_ID=MMETSP1329-20130426/38822_1 /TAXON_ID=114041 /ORGANISM="Genus nov. species nov., Strain RCC1024" /LENGTH=65 /DNA_ID=CAMNT_0007290115 /DNA_START=97 /DNA_END=291 /DNA_ORIENTATION=+